MAIMYKAKLGDRDVLVSMLQSDQSLTVYPYSEYSDMTVLSHVEKPPYRINEESGLIELESDTHLIKEARKTLYIKPIVFDEMTDGHWD